MCVCVSFVLVFVWDWNMGKLIREYVSDHRVDRKRVYVCAECGVHFTTKEDIISKVRFAADARMHTCVRSCAHPLCATAVCV